MDIAAIVRLFLYRALVRAEALLNLLQVPGEHIERFAELARQLHTPCMVVVLGQVNAGKSLFVNALLGADVAKVGNNETTATIIYFCYGEPSVPQRPVECFWQDGRKTSEPPEFLDRFQSRDKKTLREARKIDYLKYPLLSNILTGLIMVDTPGTESTISEHDETTSRFLNKNKADAVIYVFPSAGLSSTGKALLRDFRQRTTGKTGTANAIGILSKIDLDPQTLQEREQFATRFRRELPDVTTVVPISAGLKRALDSLSDERLEKFITRLHSIPPHMLDNLLTSEQAYLKPLPGCPLNLSERRQLLSWINPRVWTVFTTLAREAAKADPTQGPQPVRDALNKLAGFEQLHKILNEHILQRSDLLHSSRILNEALKEIDALRNIYSRSGNSRGKASTRLLRLVQQAGGNHKAERLLSEVGQAHESANGTDVDQLADGLLTLLSASVEKVFDRVENDLSIALMFLEKCNENFKAIRQITAYHSPFSQAEQDELKDLLWVYTQEEEEALRSLLGADDASFERHNQITNKLIGNARVRQATWNRLMNVGSNPVRKEIARVAFRRYGPLVKKLEAQAKLEKGGDKKIAGQH